MSTSNTATVTADSLTNAQINALWCEACGRGLVDADPDTMHMCTVAINHHGDFTASEQAEARARCAAIINARRQQQAAEKEEG